MNSGFSGTVRISSVDDYITPGQECIKPLTDIIKTRQKQRQTANNKTLGNDVESATDVSTPSSRSEPVTLQNGNLTDLPENGQIESTTVKITLNDCLACSGCVTTAETILIEQQSHEKLAKVLALKDTKVVVTLSSQSLASLAVKYDIPLELTLLVVVAFLKEQGVSCVLPASVARCFSLIASEREFIDRYRRAQADPTIRHQQLPVFSSACPGWVCYAEKTHGDLILPHMSQARSPQAVAGSIVKSHLAKLKDWSRAEVFHASVMPCFDKKLEAARSQLTVDLGTDEAIPETDCVISSAELDNWMNECVDGVDKLVQRATSLSNDDRRMNELLEIMWPPVSSLREALVHHGGGGSGGYAQHVITTAAHHLFNIDKPQLIVKRVNKDFEEIILPDSTDAANKPLLRFARAYGFRNIQNVVMKCKRNKMNYDYIEVMACPGGCVNGGGQIRSGNLKESAAMLEHVTQVYDNEQLQQHADLAQLPMPTELSVFDSQLKEECCGSGKCQQNSGTDVKLYTKFEALETNIAGMINW